MKKRILSGLCVVLAAASAQAVDRVWTGAVDGNWGSATNWSTGVPVNGDRAYFTSASPGTTNVVLDGNYTLSRLASTSANLLYFNSAHNYTISGPGTLTFTNASTETTTQNMLSIGTGAIGTTQTVDADLIIDVAGNQRIATITDAHWIFNGDIAGRRMFMTRLNDLNSSATFNGNVNLVNSAVWNIFGGTIMFNGSVAGVAGTGIVSMQGQGRDVQVAMGNTNGPVFRSSLSRVQLGVAPGYQMTARLDEDNQIAANVFFRSATLDLNGHSNTNAGWLRLQVTNDLPVIDFSDPASEALWFDNSTSQVWAANTFLNLVGFELGQDQLRFGTDASGLTSNQLAQIRIDGAVVDGLALDVNGYLTIGQASGYDIWAAGYPTLTGGQQDDDDGDGLLNIYEYGLGGDPTNALDQGTSPTFGTVNVGGTNYFGYIHPQLAASENSGLSYYLELSSDLVFGGWTNAGYTVLGTNVTGGPLDFVTNATTTVESKKFIRLIIE